MRDLTIDVTDLGGQAHPGDTVLLWKPDPSGSADVATRIISTAPRTVHLVAGKATVVAVEPGPMRVLLRCRGLEATEPVTVTVPDGNGPVTLRSLYEGQFQYEPPVVSAVQRAADRAADSERASLAAKIRAEAAADRADARVDEALTDGANLVRNEVKSDADRAVAAREGAQLAQSSAEGARDTAVQAATTAADDAVATAREELDGKVTAAAGSATDAAKSATAAGTAASNASSSASAASSSKTAAATSASDAQSSAGAAGTAAGAASDSAQAASGSATAASNSATAAATSETNAATSAQDAQTAQQGAETARDEAVQAAENAQTSAPAGGWSKGELAQPVQDSLTRADSALQSMPVATSGAAGAIRLTGDLGGTASAPTVVGKVSTSDVSIGIEAGKVVKRYPSGAIQVPETPDSEGAATSRAYVDSQVSTRVEGGSAVKKIEVVTAMPSNPVATTLYLVVGS
ncbi:hypothetical protein ACWIB8_12130 [Corynebacterium flavescens]